MNIVKKLLCLSLLAGLCLASVPADISAQQRTLGPVLKIYTDPFDFDTVYCGVRRCLPLTFHNVGDTTLILRNHDRLKRPFYVRIDTPLVLQPGEMRTFDLCYNAFQYTKDSQHVELRVDTRLPMSIAMVHDVSSSMWLMMPDGNRRYEGAHAASAEFIGNLLDTLNIEDEAAIYAFDDNENFEVKQTWTKDTAALRAAIPGRPLGTATCLFDALSRVSDSLLTRSKMRVLIVVTDGEDSGNPPCPSTTVTAVIKKAKENNVRIYAITIGNIDRAPLIQIVKASGGKEFNATQSSDLLAIYREIAVDMSKNVSRSIFMKGEAVGPRIEFLPSTWEFDSVQVGETACQEVLVRNGGNAWLLADSVRKVFVPPYSITGLDLDSIPPYQTVVASICFTPLVPKHYGDPMPYFPSPCEVYPDSLMPRGNSFLVPRNARRTPLLEMDMPVEGFDTTFCQTTECVTLNLRNRGDTVLTVHSMDPLPPPFSGDVSTPFDIPAGETHPVVLCYRPPDAPRRDTLHLSFTADARVPQTMALLFDQGRSMEEAFMPGLDRMIAAVSGASDFIDGLVFGDSFSDAVAIARFDSTGVVDWDGRFLEHRDTLRTQLPEHSTGRVSCIYDAVDSMLSGMPAGTSSGKSIILFSAGEDAGATSCGPRGAAAVAARAVALDTRIHCIQLGDADSTGMQELASVTGGQYQRPGTLLDLILGLRDIEEGLTGRTHFTRSIVARGVTPILDVESETLDFGSSVFTTAGAATEQRSYRVTNVGDAPMHLRLEGLTAPFDVAYQAPAGVVSQISTGDTVLDPGQHLLLESTFSPITPGLFIDTLALIHDGCMQPPGAVVFTGRSVEGFAGPWEYPAVVHVPAPLRFDTMSCGSRQCLDVLFTAPDSLPSVLHFPRELSPPFFADLPDRMTLGSGETDGVEVCYRPDDMGEHAAWLRYESLYRPAYSTVFLLARDISARDTLGEGLTYGVLTREARSMFARELGSRSVPEDEAALLAFDADGNSTVVTYTQILNEVADTDPVYTSSGSGDLAAALHAAMDYASAHARGKTVVIAMLNDAQPLEASEAAALRDRAQREHALLGIAAMGPDGYNALSGSASSAAVVDSCYTLASLQAFVHTLTQQALEFREDSIAIAGSTTASKLELEPLTLDFGQLRVGEQACLPVSMRNTGSATLELLEIVLPAGPQPDGFPRSLAPGERLSLELCYTTSRLRDQHDEILVVYDGCRRDTIVVPVSAWGTDSLAVGIASQLRGKPGSVLRIPVMLYGALPVEYDVRNCEITLRYNRSMLYPLDAEIIDNGTVTGGMSDADAKLRREFDTSSRFAVARYIVTGASPMTQSGESGTLLRPPFLVLHGDALHTDLEIMSMRFGDGIPSAGIAGSGTFTSDSLGFHEQRLLDASERYNMLVTGTWPNPFNPSVTIAFSLREQAPVRLVIHDALGREICVLVNGVHEAGMHRAYFDAGGRSSGFYYYRLESNGELLSGSVLYLK